MNNAIYPCLILKGKIEEAAPFYIDAFGDGKVGNTSPWVIEIALSGQKIMLLNDGTQSLPSPAISFMVTSRTPEETDRYWSKLSEGGTVLMALDKYPWSEKYGWLQDKFGVSWQLMTGPESDVPQKFCPSLMFTGPNAGKAKQAIEELTSLFPDSSIRGIMNYAEGDGDDTSNVKHAQFTINDYTMMAMDSSFDHQFNFVEAVSLVVECADQAEIDKYWNTLTANGGKEVMCGWLRDKYGISWQIIPKDLGKWMKDPARAHRVMDKVLKMKKLIYAELENA
ncbi:VOC family protein [Chitinophaga horti]|uniref:VOC family protein n=1 Tax=Chitinophaga horti TaxID=2920382 RepID=A0ABY6J717_9BACT|nr:VOC family protein [Chitinophaga horti]UYQ95428.1 VOC family protein [Chitinophaga horti]